MDLPSGYVKIAIENDHLQWIFPLKMVIFHSYVSLPEGSIDMYRPASKMEPRRTYDRLK